MLANERDIASQLTDFILKKESEALENAIKDALNLNGINGNVSNMAKSKQLESWSFEGITFIDYKGNTIMGYFWDITNENMEVDIDKITYTPRRLKYEIQKIPC